MESSYFQLLSLILSDFEDAELSILYEILLHFVDKILNTGRFQSYATQSLP